MPKIINLRRWHPKAYSFYGEEVVLEVKALTRQEAPEFVKRMAQLGEAWQKEVAAQGGDGESVEVMHLLDSAHLADAFSRFVRIAPDQEVSWEGQPATAETLYREGSPFFVMEVLSDIQRLAVLSVSEGKASGSLSGSRSGATEAASSDSAAQPTADWGGTAPSTATAPNAEPSFAGSTTG